MRKTFYKYKNIDNETTSIRYDTLEKLCRVLNCSPSELIEIISEEPKDC